jgi:hypothetical protein
MPKHTFDSFSSMIFTLIITKPNADGTTEEIHCGTSSRCQVTYKRSHTPLLHHLSPPVVYNGAEIDIWFNPKSTMGAITNIPEEEMPFVNFKVKDTKVNFEDTIDHTTSFSSNAWNRIRGIVNDQPISANQNVSMLWEVGMADTHDVHMKTCTLDPEVCYQAKTVPVIHSIDSHEAYTTGG